MRSSASPNDAPVVIGLVLSLGSDRPIKSALRRQLTARPELALGRQQGAWIPCTATTSDPRRIHAWLESLQDIAAVDVVFAEVTPSFDAAAPSCRYRAPNDDYLAPLNQPVFPPPAPSLGPSP